jgi:hypothetical protein
MLTERAWRGYCDQADSDFAKYIPKDGALLKAISTNKSIFLNEEVFFTCPAL